MDKTDILEEKIKWAVKTIQQLRDKNSKISQDYKKLTQENELLQSENLQVRKLIAELDRLRDERKLIRQKCEKLAHKFKRMNLA